MNGNQVTSGDQTITFSSDVESLELDAGEGGGTVIVETTPSASLTVSSLSDLVIHVLWWIVLATASGSLREMRADRR